MSITTQALSSDSLFSFKTPLTTVGIDQFHSAIAEKSPNLAHYTYSLIKTSESIEQTLKLWEIRLTLLLFEGQTNHARNEAIALNNVLYLCENDNVPPVLPPSKTPNATQIFPLPKNNNSTIDHGLIVLLLRLKSSPNLSLVNEFYKLCYLLRLRSSHDTEKLQTSLINLSMDTMSVLVINKNYATILSLLQAMSTELDPHNQIHARFSSVLLLFTLMVKALIHEANQTPKDTATRLLASEFGPHYAKMSEVAIPGLTFILQTINAVYSSTQDEVLDITPSQLTIEELVAITYKGRISGRIFCCTLGLWDLINTFEFELENAERVKLVAQGTPDDFADPTIENCYKLISRSWVDNVHKVYGLE